MIPASFKLPRVPDGVAAPSERSGRKWEQMFELFMDGDLEGLLKIQRTGLRGRIFARLAERLLVLAGLEFQREPIFNAIAPNRWYIEFADRHRLKLRQFAFCNPDFMLADGTWLELTLSENTAYQKLFIHGHQAPSLRVIWLDADMGYHKQVCEGVEFPNAEVVHADCLFTHAGESPETSAIAKRLLRLRELKGTLL